MHPFVPMFSSAVDAFLGDGGDVGLLIVGGVRSAVPDVSVSPVAGLWLGCHQPPSRRSVQVSLHRWMKYEEARYLTEEGILLFEENLITMNANFSCYRWRP